MRTIKILPGLVDRWDTNANLYFAFPVVPLDNVDNEWNEWNVVSQYMEQAKKGAFQHTYRLFELHAEDANWIRRGMYMELIGAAGPDWILNHMLSIAEMVPDDIAFDYAEAFLWWGRLDAVPVMLAIFKETCEFNEDAFYIPAKIGLLLEEELGTLGDIWWKGCTDEEIENYCQRVLQKHSELSQSLGEKAFVFRGRALDVRWVARCMIDDVNKVVPLNEKRHCEQMRAKFEGMTGIDCSPFYKGGLLQCLTTSAMLEDFLESPEVTLFSPSIRYFFSYPVPSQSELKPNWIKPDLDH